MNAELANVEGDESNDNHLEVPTPGDCVYGGPELLAQATERRPRVRRCLCVLLVLLVLLAALFLIIALAAALFVFIVPRFYSNSLVSSSFPTTTPFLPSTTFSITFWTYSTPIPHTSIIATSTSTVATTSTTLPGKSGPYQRGVGALSPSSRYTPRRQIF